MAHDTKAASDGDSEPSRVRVLSFEFEEQRLVLIELGGGPAVPSGEERLSPAEREVMRLALRGLSNEAIARSRGRAVRTVANQMASIFEKLGVTSRAELASRCHGTA